MEQRYVGKSIDRVDALEKATGRAIYAADLKLQNMLHAKVLRSTRPHARILNIDVEKAKRLPGVKVVLTGKDLPYTYGAVLKDQPILAIEKVRYAGEPVVAVAATTEEIAEEAVGLIQVEYEELPRVLDPEEAMRESILIHEEVHTYPHRSLVSPVKGTNICSLIKFKKGDAEKGFKEADHVFDHRFTSQMVQHCALEPHCAIAMMDINGKLTVWAPNDAPYRVRNDLAKALGIPLTKIRVIIPYMGGGFGGKGGLTAEPVCVALAIHAKGRPVRIVLTREEVFTSALVRHPCMIELKTGVKANGKLWARKVRLIWDTGAYAEKGPNVARAASLASAGPYNIPNIEIEGYCVYTNKVTAGAFRGYGSPQITWAFESQMDIIAERLGLDPLELRLMNAVEEGDLSPKGDVLHSVGLKECLQKASDSMHWTRPRKEEHRGRGIACMHKWQGVYQSTAIVRINEDGTVSLLTSAVEIGQGSRTILSQIAAEELSIPPERITVAFPDTDSTPYDASTTGSRSSFNMGNAVLLAARDAKEQLLALAEELLEADREDLLIQDGEIYVKGSEGKKVSFSKLMELFGDQRGMILGKGSYMFSGFYTYGGKESKTPNTAAERPQAIPWMYAAQAAEVKVDVRTGIVNVERISAAHDVGRAINPRTCEQQIEGSLGMGVGATLFEGYQYKDGVPLNPNFQDYKIPTFLDVPEMTPIIVESHHKDGPFGAKGLGEPGLAPTAAAISNAIYDAIGVRIYDLPITPEKVLKELQKKGKASG